MSCIMPLYIFDMHAFLGTLNTYITNIGEQNRIYITMYSLPSKHPGKQINFDMYTR